MLDTMLEPVYQKLLAANRPKLAEMYKRCFKSTWETTLQRYEDGGVFLITGDIPAMWLRDSSAQVWHYLAHAKEYKEVEEVVEKLLEQQFFCVSIDPYSNAFNREANNNRLGDDRTNVTPEQLAWIWERKYEIDSLCYPIRLAYHFWKETGNTAWCNETFHKAAHNIIDVWEKEQHHGERSEYYFERDNCPQSDTLPNEGKGAPVGYTGMTWSGFRPSDDACMYGYLIPSNLFAAKSLEQLAEIIAELAPDADFEARIRKLHDDIRSGIEKYGIIHHEKFGDMYAYETDGLGHYNLMDDANVPSLLSLPYLGACDAEDEIYQNTRRFVLSTENPYYYEGKAARGIGSPHTPKNYIWPISLSVQGLTSIDKDEILQLADTLETVDADTYLMHEGFDKDDPKQFTRPWFAWANSIFSEFVEKAAELL